MPVDPFPAVNYFSEPVLKNPYSLVGSLRHVYARLARATAYSINRVAYCQSDEGTVLAPSAVHRAQPGSHLLKEHHSAYFFIFLCAV